MQEEDDSGSGVSYRGLRINLGYAVFQMAKALVAAGQHADAQDRQRARARVGKWAAVMAGVLGGKLDVGSRAPVADVPAWATLEVVTGGFATGRLPAGGPLREHEKAMLAGSGRTAEPDARLALNKFFLTDSGLEQLQEMLRSGRYDIEVPEEGALLVAAWLVTGGYAEEARSLLEALAPFFSKLRFYPVPAESPRRAGERVFLQDVGRTIKSLESIRPNRRVLAQKEAVEVWAPLYDRTVALFLETVRGEAPDLGRNADGSPRPRVNGRFPVEGGWPCANFPEGWAARGEALLAEYDAQRKKHGLCGRPDRAKDSFAQLRGYLRRCLTKPDGLSGREVGRIRLILARYAASHGAPDSAARRQLRQEQLRQAGAPTFKEIAGAVVERLGAHPRDGGLEDIAAIAQPVSADEAVLFEIPEGTAIPPSIEEKVRRCLSETIDVLVERGIVTSGETMARVLPQMTSGIRAAGIKDPALRQLYSAVYRAFRRRRSLLLLDLQSQVKIEELPWVAAIERFRTDALSDRDLARQTLEEIVVLALASFPHAILPNKLLQELRALAKGAYLDLPLVEEVAVDIFQGRFSDKFILAAKRAAETIDGTLYSTYYGIDCGQLRSLPSGVALAGLLSRREQDPLVELCESRAGLIRGAWGTVSSGMIIEQQQILTTQNLAVLFEALNLREGLGGQLPELARRCFLWVCRRQQARLDRKTGTRHASLIMLKNTAYAWRQMIFFLALLPPAQVGEFLLWARVRLEEQPEAFRSRFRPALEGLVRAAAGRSPDAPPEARRFLGWTRDKRHWMLEAGAGAGAGS